MAVVLRLARGGKHKAPAYRIVATDKQNRRDGRFLEVLGSYAPVANPAKVVIKEDLIKKWVLNGAQPSEVVANIIKKNIPGFLEGREEHRVKKIQAARRKRKERAKTRAA